MTKTHGTRITDEYAAAIVDTRSRIHFGPELSMTMQIPQRDVAERLIEHWGCGEINSYRSPGNGRFYNHVTVKAPELMRVLESVKPHMVGRTRGFVEAALRAADAPIGV
jgi:hypothetical protein